LHHGHLPSITPDVVQRFSANGVLASQLMDVLRDNLHLSPRRGTHAVSFSPAEIAKLDQLIDKHQLFSYTPKRQLNFAETDTVGGPTVNLESKSVDVAIRWYTKFLAGTECSFDDKEASIFTDEHDTEEDFSDEE
jgi:hypothetical protein